MQSRLLPLHFCWSLSFLSAVVCTWVLLLRIIPVYKPPIAFNGPITWIHALKINWWHWGCFIGVSFWNEISVVETIWHGMHHPLSVHLLLWCECVRVLVLCSVISVLFPCVILTPPQAVVTMTDTLHVSDWVSLWVCVCVCPCPQHVCLFKRLLKLFFSSFHLATSPYHLWNNKGVLKQSSVSCACAEVRRGVDGVNQEKFVCQLLFLLHAQGWSWKWILSCKANLSYTYLPDKIYTK